MGLLDGNLDPQTASTLALAGGLLSPGSFGQGLTSGLAARQAVLSNAQDMDIKKQQLAMQQLQYAAALRNQNLVNTGLERYVNGSSGGATPAPAPDPSAPPSQPSVMAGQGSQPPFMSSNQTMGGTAAAAPPTQANNSSSPMGGLPFNIGFPELAFNGGKSLADLTMKYNTPTSLRSGGYAYFPGKGMVQLPQVPEGYTAVQAPDGSFSMQPVPGGVAALGASSAAKASGPAGFKQTEIIGADGKKYTVFNSQLPGFNGAPPSLSPPIPMGPTPPPASAISPPGSVIPPAVQAQRDAEGAQVAPPGPNGAPAPDFGTTDLAALRASIAREQSLGPAHAANVQTLTQLLQQRQGGAAPAGGVQTGYAPGELTGADANATNNANELGKKWTSQSAANQQAQTTNSYLDSIVQASKTASTGPFSDRLALAQALAAPFSTAADNALTARQLLDKYSNQIVARLGQGDLNSDAARSILTAAYPNSKMTTGAIAEAAANLRGANNMIQARTALLQPIAASRTAGANATYDATATKFDTLADPRLWQLKNMDPIQAQSYLKNLPDSVRTDLMNRATQLKAMGVL